MDGIAADVVGFQEAGAVGWREGGSLVGGTALHPFLKLTHDST